MLKVINNRTIKTQLKNSRFSQQKDLSLGLSVSVVRFVVLKTIPQQNCDTHTNRAIGHVKRWPVMVIDVKIQKIHHVS